MVYYTVHGRDEHPTWNDGHEVSSIADDFGLDKRLGFRPRWCSGLYEDSLAESWFAIWCASPQYVEEISFITSDEAVPIDALTWTKVREKYMDAPIGEPGWLDEFECIFDVEHTPNWRREYLVPDDPEHTITIPAPLLCSIIYGDSYVKAAAETVAKIVGFDNVGKGVLEDVFSRIADNANRLIDSAGMRRPVGIETAYRLVVQLSGVPSLLWSLATKGSFNVGVLSMSLNEYASEGSAYDKAQHLLQAWDEDASSFKPLMFARMHDYFKEAISDAVYQSCMREFGDIGRNEPCPCGSGKKFKKCHGIQHDVDWYVGLGDGQTA